MTLKHLICSFAWFIVLAWPHAVFAQLDFGLYSLKPSANPSAVVQTEQVRAELVAYAPEGVASGKPLWFGLLLQHQPEWHTYWHNPGDSGLATALEWRLPNGLTAAEVSWPTPKKMTIGSLANFGYEDTVLLPVSVQIDPSWRPTSQPNTLQIELQATWLVCRQECIPQQGSFRLDLPVHAALTLHADTFEQTLSNLPRNHTGSSQAQLSPDGIQVQVQGLPSEWHGQPLRAFAENPGLTLHPQTPYDSDAVSNEIATRPGTQGWQNGVWSAVLPISPERGNNPITLPLLIAHHDAALRIAPDISGTWPPLKTQPGVSPALQAALDAQQATVATTSVAPIDWPTLLAALLGALLGGMLLNLMPCVFPVLAIKVLSVAQHSDTNRHARAEGWAYSAGVVLSFMLLGALLWALRAGGEQLGWGFQLQSPVMITTLAVLFTLIALNLMGWIQLNHWVPQRLANLQLRHPLADAFLSGVLAVVIASPCTAPLMGASVGYALTLPGAASILIFAVLGVGMALPMLVLRTFPALTHYLPRPGVWMENLRQALAFPMLATVIWLIWVMGHLNGIDGATSLLAVLGALSMVVWAMQLPADRSKKGLVVVSLLTLAIVLWSLGRPTWQLEPTPTLSESNDTKASQGNGVWQAWQPGRVEAELAAGRAVFVDFTAAWCITCQYNKQTTLSDPELLNHFAQNNVTLLRADWTRRDPNISLALQQLGRNGVPVYALYQNGSQPILFGEILSKQSVMAALTSR
jgi:thiol:disulfide interchange protein DsbD